MAKRRSRALIEADAFHAIVVSLLRVPHDDWDEWQETWLLDEARRPSDYIYSDKERAVLNKFVAFSKTLTDYAGYTVSELARFAYPHRAEFDEDDEEYLEQLREWRVTDLKLRHVRRLASICRLFMLLDYDEAAAFVENPIFIDEFAAHP
jgi:hypothetical protein